MPLGPPATFAVITGKPSIVAATTHPDEPAPVQSCVSPKKKKSVPAPTLGLKNSVQLVQIALVDVSSCCENAALVFIVRPTKPKAYCQGVVSAAPVPHSRICPL